MRFLTSRDHFSDLRNCCPAWQRISAFGGTYRTVYRLNSRLFPKLVPVFLLGAILGVTLQRTRAASSVAKAGLAKIRPSICRARRDCGLCDPDVRRCERFCGSVFSLSFCRRTVPRNEHSQKVHGCHHCVPLLQTTFARPRPKNPISPLRSSASGSRF